jgi:hypothetical protein
MLAGRYVELNMSIRRNLRYVLSVYENAVTAQLVGPPSRPLSADRAHNCLPLRPNGSATAPPPWPRLPRPALPAPRAASGYAWHSPITGTSNKFFLSIAPDVRVGLGAGAGSTALMLVYAIASIVAGMGLLGLGIGAERTRILVIPVGIGTIPRPRRALGSWWREQVPRMAAGGAKPYGPTLLTTWSEEFSPRPSRHLMA